MDEEVGNSVSSFQPADYAAFGVILSISCLIGIYFAWKDKHENSVDGYFLAGRSMNPVAVGMSMLVTYLSAVGLISSPAEVYIVGDMQLWNGIFRPMAVVTTIVYLIPAFRRLNLRTMVEYFGMRFTVHIRRFAAAMDTLTALFNSGLVIYAAAVALSAVTPIATTWSIAVTSAVCILYTSLGGMKAVIWTDAIQTIFTIGGILALFIQGVIAIGGFKELDSALARGQRHTFLRFDFGVISRVSPLAFALGQFTRIIYAYGFSQQTMQRHMSCKTTAHARWASGFNMIIGSLVTTSIMSLGLVLFALYESCDPVYSGVIGSIDQIVPYTTLSLFKDLPGMPGLFIAAIFSAALSTISSNLNAFSLVIVQELLCVIWKPLHKSDRLKVYVGKIMVVVLGLIVVGIAFAASFSRSNIIKLLYSSLGVLSGPITGAYVLGFFFPKANSKGASIGILISFSFGVFLFVCSEFLKIPYQDNIPPRFKYGCPSENTTMIPIINATVTTYTTETFEVQRTTFQNLCNLNYHMFVVLGTVNTILFGYVASLLTGPQDPAKLDPKLFIPLVDNKCLPSSVRKFFRFGVPEIEKDKCNNELEHYDTIVEDKL